MVSRDLTQATDRSYLSALRIGSDALPPDTADCSELLAIIDLAAVPSAYVIVDYAVDRE